MHEGKRIDENRCTCHVNRTEVCPTHSLSGAIRRGEDREATMVGANARQVAGDHYASEGMQHWDWVHALRLNYFQAQASRYISRWTRKNGIEDLEKAVHYCDKAEELGYGSHDLVHEDWQRLTFRFCADNNLSNDDYLALREIVTGNYALAGAMTRDRINAMTQKVTLGSRG